MKKTISILSLLEKTNKFNSSSSDDAIASRSARNIFVTSLLHEAGAYSGFMYLEERELTEGATTVGIRPHNNFNDTDTTRIQFIIPFKLKPKVIQHNKPKTYQFYEDPAHGWLKVLKTELVDLGIQNDISPYSYQRGESVYLEEDADFDKFVTAKGKAAGINLDEWKTIIKINNNSTNRQSKIRKYEKYDSGVK